MRNWMNTLRAASYRGVPFHVAEESMPETGREVVVHRYVKAEKHDTEDMGILPKKFRIKAYIANDRADTDCAALVAACGTKGAATLVLPFLGGHQVRATGCGPSWRKEQLGFVSLDLEFIAAGGDGSGFPALPIGDRIAASALDDLAGLVEDLLATLPF